MTDPILDASPLDRAASEFLYGVYLDGLRSLIVDREERFLTGQLGDVTIRTTDQATGRITIVLERGGMTAKFGSAEGPLSLGFAVTETDGPQRTTALPDMVNDAVAAWRSLSPDHRAALLTVDHG